MVILKLKYVSLQCAVFCACKKDANMAVSCKKAVRMLLLVVL